jgi:predicted amidohydrolase YtcJ
VKLFINCRAYAFDPKTRTYGVEHEFGIDGPRFTRVGTRSAEIETISERIDLGGATVVPAFADCHVHLAETGYLLGERDLSDVRDAASFEARVAALPRDVPYLFAGKLDDAGWPGGAAADPAALERHHAGRCVLISRVDVHSCLVNARTFAELALEPRLAGIERDDAGLPTGRLSRDANYAAQERFFARLPASERRAAASRAARLALERGAVHLHAQLLGLKTRAAYAEEIAFLRGFEGTKIHPKICERDPALAASFGLPYVGGDVFLDGSLGSGTAATSASYCDRASRGTLMLEDAEVERFFREAERLGISAGVHAIGDRAIEQCLAAWERVLDGTPSARARHFIEHFEMASPEQIARAARLGLYLSVQPQFDAAWGGTGGMYDRRLGNDRMHGMNALRSALDAGATLCGGDDSPVCDLSPLDGMAAACAHHAAEHRIEPLEALTMYAYDAARFGHAETHTGALQAGFDADFVVLDRDPFADGSFAETRVLQTWSDGVCVFGGAA